MKYMAKIYVKLVDGVMCKRVEINGDNVEITGTKIPPCVQLTSSDSEMEDLFLKESKKVIEKQYSQLVGRIT